VRKGEETRDKILHRAARLFNEKGYFGSSLSDIMRVTGLQKGGVYNHFVSKEKLALESFDFALGLVKQRFESALAGKTNAVDRMLAIIDMFRNYLADPPMPGGCPLMNTAIESDDAHPVLRQRARRAMDEWHRSIQRIVSKGVQRKEIRAATDPAEVASLVIATLEGGVMLSRLYRDPVHLTRAADHLSRYVQDLRA
jgi:TetR/AcrR family transcriptional repressor of nem operon